MRDLNDVVRLSNPTVISLRHQDNQGGFISHPALKQEGKAVKLF